MAVTYETRKLSALLEMASWQKLVLPNFQREYVWSIDAQQRLVASTLTDVPVGSTLILAGQNDDYAARRLGELVDATPPEECNYLLDGQQRLSTLQSAFRSPFFCDLRQRPWKEVWDDVPAKLRYSWTLRIEPRDEEDDIFGYEWLQWPDLSQVEPDQIAAFLEPERILKKHAKSPDAWTHPAWNPQLETAAAVARARHALKHKSIPLWGIGGDADQRGVTDTALQLIAGARRDELAATYRTASEDLQNKIYAHLLAVSPALPGSRRQCTETELDGAFSDLAANWRAAFMSFLDAAVHRVVPAIFLTRADLPRAVAIFEVINQGGTPLTAFDLVVAKNARDPKAPNLVQTLQDSLSRAEVGLTPIVPANLQQPRSTWSLENRDMLLVDGSLTSAFKNSFLNMLSILHATRHDGSEDNDWGVSGPPEHPWSALDVRHIKRSMIMQVPSESIATNSEIATTAILRAWAFLQLRCGIRTEGDLRYKLMVLPLAHVFARKESVWSDPAQLDRLEYWYWVSLFGGTYRERQNENAVRDIRSLADWIIGDSDNPFSDREVRVLKVEEYSDLPTLTLESPDASVSSDVGHAVLQYTLSRIPLDFDPAGAERPLRAWDDVVLEDHHIVPVASAKTLRESAIEIRRMGNHPLNSPMNRTFISRSANREIGALSPGNYLREVNAAALVSHFLPAEIQELNLSEATEGTWRSFIRRRAQAFRDALVNEVQQLRS